MAKVIKQEFKSIADFEEYLNKTPLNDVFRWAKLVSTTYEYGFNVTHTFPEAKELLNKGWEKKAEELEQKLQIEAKQVRPKTVQRMKYDVVGFQASVPRYLQGIPTNMFNSKPVVQKQKVITIVKHIGYRGNVSAQTVLENSIKALIIVKKIEAQGYRVNLDVISPAESGGEIVVCRVRIKSANERLNISKIAFPMVHPDMLRRMVFRFRETHPDIKSNSWRFGMGCTIYDGAKVKSFLNEGEYYLHNFIGDINYEIQQMKLK